MPTFSQRSHTRLQTCHPDLIRLCQAVIKATDFSVLEGYRAQKRQDYLYSIGRSKLKWPNSNHNHQPSRAVDVAPYPIDWTDLNRFHALAGHLLMAAHQLDIALRWGGHWPTFKDYPHFELAGAPPLPEQGS
jgi:peptidoglycan LD-endopeptidase CwlK